MHALAPPVLRKRRRARELGPHRAILKWLEYTLPKSWIVHHSPNQGHGRSARQGAILKGMGVKAGFPDLMIIGPRDKICGDNIYFVEVKDADDGRRSDKQKDLHAKMTGLGWSVGIAHDIDEMRQLARLWMLPIRDVTGARQ